MGGQTALNLAVALAEVRRRLTRVVACVVRVLSGGATQSGVLAKHNVELIGAKLDAIRMAEDRQLFKEAMQRIGLKTPQSGTACTYVSQLHKPRCLCLLPTLSREIAGWSRGWPSLRRLARIRSSFARRSLWAALAAASPTTARSSKPS